MISRSDLEWRFERIDQLLDTIQRSEDHLDRLLYSTPPRDTVPISVVPLPPLSKVETSAPISERSEAELADDVALRIKQARHEQGWRQKDLAAATGIARPNIARLESGRRMPKISTLHKISQALGIPVETLLGR